MGDVYDEEVKQNSVDMTFGYSYALISRPYGTYRGSVPRRQLYHEVVA